MGKEGEDYCLRGNLSYLITHKKINVFLSRSAMYCITSGNK